MRVLEAEIKGGKVYVDGAEALGVKLLCEGKSDSSGYFLIDKEQFFYITKTTQDLTTAFDKLINLINTLSTGFVDAAVQGSPVYKPNFITDLATLKQDIEQIKERQT
jgi:hypothetical protein